MTELGARMTGERIGGGLLSSARRADFFLPAGETRKNPSFS